MKRIVVKVGSAVLTESGSIALQRMQHLVDFIAKLQDRYEVILVSSGAVAAGHTELKLDISILEHKQALASIGQPILMDKYRKKFAAHSSLCAQVLITAANFESNRQVQKLKNTINTLILSNILPIINENDATATEELIVGDNDQLSAYVANHFDADMLVILSDIDAYYSSDPRLDINAKSYKLIQTIDPDELAKKPQPHGVFATGGILTKLHAASYLLKHNRKMFLASGFDLRAIESYLLHDTYIAGTLFAKDSEER